MSYVDILPNYGLKWYFLDYQLFINENSKKWQLV